MTLQIFTDGGSLNNPGQAAYSYVIYEDKKLLLSFSETIGVATNNVAEYTALIKALEAVRGLLSKIHPPAGGTASRIEVYSDSSLMINQLNGLFKVKNSKIRELIWKIRNLEGEIIIPISYMHINREKNSLADSLVKKALKSS